MFGGSAPESASSQIALPGRDRATVVTGAVLVVITAVAWARVVQAAMTPDPMQGMFMAPTVHDGFVYVASWTIMMAAMMLPSALPMIGLYAATQQSARRPARKILPVTLFTLGLVVFTGIILGTTLEDLRNKADINVYFTTTAPE